MDMAEIEEYKETQRLLDEGMAGYLPEKISNRMLKRLVGVGGWRACIDWVWLSAVRSDGRWNTRDRPAIN